MQFKSAEYTLLIIFQKHKNLVEFLSSVLEKHEFQIHKYSSLFKQFTMNKSYLQTLLNASQYPGNDLFTTSGFTISILRITFNKLNAIAIR